MSATLTRSAQRTSSNRRDHALAAEALGQPRPGQHDHALGRIADPARVRDRVAVSREGRRRRVDLLDAAVPEVATLVDELVLLELLDPPPHAQWVPLRRHALALEGADDAVGMGLAH